MSITFLQAPVVHNPAETTTFPPNLSVRADRIRRYLRTGAIEAGQELIQARKECPPGLWVNWLRLEFGWSERTAYNLMNVAETFATVANDIEIKELPIDVSALYALSEREVPQKIRNEILNRARSGERITRKKAIIAVKQSGTDVQNLLDKASDRVFGQDQGVTDAIAPIDDGSRDSREEIPSQQVVIPSPSLTPQVYDSSALPITVMLTKPEYEKLKRWAAATGVTIPEALKEAIALLPDRPGGTSPAMREEVVQ